MPNDESTSREILAYTTQENINEAVETERRVMARTLESTVISQLTLILSQANAYEQTLRTPEAQMAVSVLSSLAKQAIQQARDLQDTLHPIVLDTLGLESALEALVNQEQRRYGARITLRLQRLRKRLPDVIELALFRITQDAIDRAMRIANAGHIIIHLEKTNDDLHFSIQDDGLASIENHILPYQRRISVLGGSLDVKPRNPHGTDIQIYLPLKPAIELTAREIEVLRFLTTGLTNKEIAYHLKISPRTVKFHLDNVYSKLGVNTRTEAAIYALQQGLSLTE